MKHLLLALFTLISLTSLGQDKIKKKINYVRSFREESDSLIVELGNNPQLCFLRRKNNPNFPKYLALLKQYKHKGYFQSGKLLEIGVEEETNNIKFFRVLSKPEEEKHEYLQPHYGVVVSAVVSDKEMDSLYDEALELFHKKQYEDAIVTINKVIVINTQNPDYHKFKAYCLSYLKQYKQSTDEIKFALEMDGANSELYEIMANNFYFLKDNENAIKCYEQAIEYERENLPRVYHNYIRCLIEIPSPQRAIEVYKLYQYRTDHETGYSGDTERFSGDLVFYAGQAYEQIKDWKTAFDIYDRLIVISPDVYGYYAQRGRLYQQKGDFSEAISDFETALKLDTAQSILLTNLAQIYQQLHDYKKAESAYKEYLSKNPDDAIEIGNYGYLLLGKEEYNDAQMMFEKSIYIDNKNIDTHIGRILAAYFLGDTENKNRFIAKAKLQFPEITIDTTTLKTLIKTGNYYYPQRLILVWENAIF
ncbi:Tfp pilus assembly protein PilF [Chitinophaga sp. CF118]|uniref:tetratricopeptide repeat protein n=1 Tax=Chitinophaga sp. CF118 TaxID=1884367 RepID=UPI0008F329C1|nr:tetratricopeptide repeat protein [Chitinophaga sp. CF118]SFE09353.1 Tfp pilus assembly protein PilF [Chitinophaga sp. CF118]